MKNIYQPPESDLDNINSLSAKEQALVEEAQALQQLYQEQRIVSTPINALFVTAFVLILMLMVEGHAPMLVFLLPAFICGAVIKYWGRLLDLKHRVISSLVVALVVYFGLDMVSFNAVWLAVLAWLNFLVCLAMSRRPLSFDQEKLLFSESLGKISRHPQ